MAKVILASAVTSTPPMGLFSIGDELVRAGHEVRIVHVDVERSLDPSFDLGRYAELREADLVGIAIHWAHQALESVRLARSVKTARPQTFVVAGGLTASSFAGEIVETVQEFDGVIRGEGEVPMRELARELESAAREGRSARLASVPNLVWRDPQSAGSCDAALPIANTTSPRPARLRLMVEVEADPGSGLSIPMGIRANRMGFVAHGADYAALRYAHPEFLEHRDAVMAMNVFGSNVRPPVFLLAASRGCPFECSFCGGGRSAHGLLGARQKAEHRPLDSVMEDLRTAAREGYRSFYVCHDPVPNGPYYFELFERIRAERLGQRLALGFGSWGLPNLAFLKQARATFREVFLEISPEVFDPQMRGRIRNYGYANADLEERLRVADELDIRVELFFAFPFPGETFETMRRTRAYALELARRYSDNIQVSVLSLSTDPQSPLMVDPDAWGVTVETRSFKAYVDALARGWNRYPASGHAPWLQNHLYHRPLAVSRRELDIAGLAATTQYSLTRRRQLLVHAAAEALGGALPLQEFLEEALAPLLDELQHERDTEGALQISGWEVGRRGIRAFTRAIERRMEDSRPALASLARETFARETVLTKRKAQREVDAAHKFLTAASRRTAEICERPMRLPVERVRVRTATPFDVEPRAGLSALVEMPSAAPESGGLEVMVSVDASGEEWLIEARPELLRAYELCDGSRSSTEVAACLGDAERGANVLAELLEIGAVH